MANVKYRIYLKSFSEYVYRTLKSLTADQKKMLSDDDQKIVKDTTTISNFCNMEQLDRLLITLTKVGKTWTLCIGDQDTDFEEINFNIVNQFQSDQKKADITLKIAEQGIFYLGANDTMMSLMMATQNVNSPFYQLSVSSRELSKKMSNIKAQKIPFEEQVERSISAWQDLNKILTCQLNSFDWAREAMGLEQDEIRILSALFVKRTSAMTLKEIAEGTMLNGKMAYLKKNVDKLLIQKLITSDKDHGPKLKLQKGKQAPRTTFYMMSQEGIRKVMQYSEYVVKNSIK